MQYNARMKHLHLEAHKHCVRGAASIACVATAGPHRHMCEIVGDKQANCQLKHKILQVVIKTKQSDAIPSYRDGAG